MPLAQKLKQLRLKMASMHSSRSQCCCCAVGVFAALFGIFMLSAGICIVLNVNYMEVDTSGLPPELHNEDGKRVVGIILICVALGALGLSVTVSIVYFAVCNRNPRRAIKTTSATGTANGGVTHNANGTYSNNTQNHRPASDPIHQRTADGSRNSFDSQLSLNSLPRHRRPSPSLASARGASALRQKKAKNHRKRPPRYQTGLPPHIEEPETAKSQVDLKLHQSRFNHSPSSSKSNMTHSHPNPSTSYTVDETQKSGNVPAIVINDSSSSPHLSSTHPMSDSHASQSIDMTSSNMSFSNTHAIGESLILTEESTLFDEADTDEPDALDSHPEFEFQQNSVDVSTNDSNHADNADAENPPIPIPPSNSSGFTSQQEHHPHPVSTSPESMIPSTADVINEKEEASSIDSYTHNIVQVQPKNKSDFSHPHSDKNSHSKGEQLENDNISELPPSSRHHEMYTELNDTDSDRRCESQSSFNSAFSNDGGDPDVEDMKRMHERMRELLN